MPRAPKGPRKIGTSYWAVRTVDGHKYSLCLGSDKGKAERALPDAVASLGPEKPRLYHPQELITITEWDPSTGTAQEVTREA